MRVTEKREQVCRYALDLIDQAIAEIRFGSITVIIQDGYIIQLEKNEKIRLDAANLHLLKEKRKTEAKRNKEELHARILLTLKELQYGQVVILIKEGTVVQLERTDKQRFTHMQGIYGEGI
jgi:hypothetical protein